MALLALERASEDIHYASFETTTEDRGDHSFSGVFFALTCDAHVAPVAACEVNALSVRGGLGAMKVYYRVCDVTRDNEVCAADTTERYGSYRADDERIRRLLDASSWTLAYDADVGASDFKTLVRLDFAKPIEFSPGEKLELYVHSAEESDQGLVYDDAPDLCGRPKDDGILQIWPGYAHLSSVPFGTSAPWYEENSYSITSLRRDRRFVGKVQYGVRWKLWEPMKETHASFPVRYREVVQTILLGMKDRNCLLSALDYDVVMYIFNKHIGWDWFGNQVDPPALPPLETSSGSAVVDAALRALTEHHASGSKGDAVKDTYMEQIEIVTNVTATLISQSVDLRDRLDHATPPIRMQALLHITKNIYEHCRKENVNALKFARDTPTVQSITDRVCALIAHRQNWQSLEEPEDGADDAETEAARRLLDEEHKKAVTNFLNSVAIPSLRRFFLMNRQHHDSDDEIDDFDDVEDDDDIPYDSDLDADDFNSDYDDEDFDDEVDEDCDFDDEVDEDS